VHETGIGDCYIQLVSNCEVCKIGAVKAILRGVNEFLSVLSKSMADMDKTSYKKPVYSAVEHLRVS
jgi:hypothetical protein